MPEPKAPFRVPPAQPATTGALPRDPAEFCWLAAALLVPLAFDPWGCNVFELPKAMLVQALALAGWAARLAHPLPSRRLPRALRVPAFAVSAYALALLTATAFSVDFRTSLWGSALRQQGILTLAGYLALGALAATGIRSHIQARRLTATLVLGSVPAVLYGLVQFAGLDPLPWQTDAASRVLSTIGRANFLGSYLVLLVPLTLAESRIARRTGHTGRSWLLLGLAVAQGFVVLATQARGAWIGLAVGLVVYLLVAGRLGRDRQLTLAGIVLTVVIVAGFTLLVVPGSPVESLARLPGLNRMAAITRTGEGSVAARLTIWRTGASLLLARPVTGYGPDALTAPFLHVFPPELVYYQGREQTVDRLHNLWLDAWSNSGIVAPLAIATFAGVVLWLSLRRRGGSPADHALKAGLVAGLAGHLVDMQFGFEVTTTSVVFWLVAALAVSTAWPSLPCGTGQIAARRTLAAPLAVAGLLAVASLCVRPLLADLRCAVAQDDARPLTARLAAAEQARRIWPAQLGYLRQLASLEAAAGQPARADGYLEQLTRLSPADPRVWADRAALNTEWGVADSSRLPAALAAIEHAIALAPAISDFHLQRGLILTAQGDPAGAVMAFERAVALDATNGIAWQHLAGLYRAAGRVDDANRADAHP